MYVVPHRPWYTEQKGLDVVLSILMFMHGAYSVAYFTENVYKQRRIKFKIYNCRHQSHCHDCIFTGVFITNCSTCLDVPEKAQTTPSLAALPPSGLLISYATHKLGSYMYKHYLQSTKLSS